jgi:hypothetical protein
MIDIDMHIADMQDGIAIKGRRQCGQPDIIMLNLYTRGVPAAAPVKSRQFQAIANNGVYGVPVLDMKNIEATTEDALFVVIFNPQAKARMHPAKSFFELFDYRLFMRIND